MKNSRLLLLLGVFLALCNASLRAEIYGSGVFLLNDGPVYSNNGNYLGSGSGSFTYSSYGSVISGIDVNPSGYWTYTGYIPPFYPQAPHTITASAINGTVSKFPDLAIYDYGAQVILNAAPQPGYIFKNWTRNGNFFSNYSSILTVNAVADSEFVANFELISRISSPDTAKLVWEQQQTGTSSSRDLILHNKGNSQLNITGIVCPEGFSADWTGQIAPGREQSIPITFTPTNRGVYSGTITIVSDATGGTTAFAISAGAENVYALTASSTFPVSSMIFTPANFRSKNGLHFGPLVTTTSGVSFTTQTFTQTFTQTTRPTTRSYWEGSVVHLQASAISGYVFKNWTENGQVISNTAEFDLSILGGHNVLANYETISQLLRVDFQSTFGARRVGSTSQRFVRISNTGNSPVFVTGLSFVARLGDRRSAFAGDWSGWIQPGQVQRVSVTFKPTRHKIYRSVVSVNAVSLTSDVRVAVLDGSGL